MSASRIEYLMKHEAMTKAEAIEYAKNNPLTQRAKKERKCDVIKRLKKAENISKKAAEQKYRAKPVN